MYAMVTSPYHRKLHLRHTQQARDAVLLSFCLLYFRNSPQTKEVPQSNEQEVTAHLHPAPEGDKLGPCTMKPSVSAS